MQEGSFEMHKWKSNNDEVLRSLELEENGKCEETFVKQSHGVSENSQRDTVGFFGK